jgi:hypothetical protein
MITGKVGFITIGMNMTKERCNRRKKLYVDKYPCVAIGKK